MARNVWRILVGIKDALVLLLMLLFFGLLYAALSASPYSASAPDGALILDLSGAIVEQPSVQSPAQMLGGGGLTREHRLRDIVHALDTAAGDERIRSVALDLDIFVSGGQTAIANVADALDRVRRAGKPVIAYSIGYSDDSYQLAAHASEVWLNPLGGVLVTGRGGSNLYYAGLLERLGITAHVYRAGAYKSAVEPFTRNDMSPESREASQELAGALWGNWLQDVGRARPRARIADYAAATANRIAAANGDMARAALADGLVDRLGDRVDFGRRVAEIAGAGDQRVPGSFQAVRLDAWLNDNPPSDSGGRIGVITVAGTIVDGEAGPGTAGAETIVEAIEDGLRDRRLRALVVRVDSPGGSSMASERIRRALHSVRERGIPVIVSFGSVAASGGYWIATAGDMIFAEPSTITGSIGVFGILPSFEGALSRLGIGADGVRTTPLSGEPDLFRGPSAEVDRVLQMGVDNTYRRFLGLVAQARRLPVARVHEIAQGRVWDGGTAHQIGLVDRFGSLTEAVAEAARRAEIDVADAGIVWLEQEPGFLAGVLRSLAGGGARESQGDVYSLLAQRPQALLGRALEDAQAMLDGPAIQLRCMECAAGAPSVRGRTRPLLDRLLALLRS
ncbi:signal peptide peptidase SppA [Allosphingosinicella sp.]|jgi:protease-4|uniref:signal peptide peptidase SppA n=1 Tax=Allosphingosinicella sp. TaxID=2823234 RepID=UPI002F2029EA